MSHVSIPGPDLGVLRPKDSIDRIETKKASQICYFGFGKNLLRRGGMTLVLNKDSVIDQAARDAVRKELDA